jgi:hypothetical protein
MKRSLLIAMCFVLSTSAAFTQTPNVSVYFDEFLTQTSWQCPGAPVGTVYDTVYVVANNFEMWMVGIEYMIDYSPALAWVADIFPPNTLHTGSSPAPGGVEIAWSLPANGWQGVLVQRAAVLWMCDSCTGFETTLVTVLPHPMSGQVRAMRWPEMDYIPGVGMLSIICNTIPVEETSWGQVKALYQ